MLTLSLNLIKHHDRMETAMAAAVAAMEQALRRLDAALASRAVAFRALGEQHGQLSLELRTTTEALQAARSEAIGLRERADLVDALRAELAAMQAEREQQPEPVDAPPAVSMPAAAAPAVSDAAADEIAALKAELAECRAYEAELLQRLDAIMARLRQALAEPAA